MMRDSHPGDFERILEIRGRKLPYYSRVAGELNVPRPIGDTGIFTSCHGTGALMAGRARRVVQHFGHSRRVLGYPFEVTSEFSCQLMMRR